MKQREAKLQLKIRKSLQREIGGFWIKIHGGPFQMSGLPDLIGCVQGLFCGIEIKTERGRIKPHQLIILSFIRRAGGLGIYVKSEEEAIRRVKRYLRKNGKVIKNKAVEISKKGSQKSLQGRKLRFIHDYAKWEDHYDARRSSSIVAKKKVKKRTYNMS